MRHQRELARAGASKLRAKDTTIVQPRDLPAVRTSQVCGFCHSMKWWDRKEGWPERGFSFRPGDDLEATTPIIRPKQVEKQPWLKNVLEKNPELFNDFFWSDGMVRVSGRDYNGLIESPCYKGGNFTCLSCHSLHKSDPDDQLARNRTDNRACTQCHPRFGEEPALTAHTHHSSDSSGSECYNCHMPHTTYGVMTAIRSHQVSSPRIADEQATGRPNACNLCHLDKTLAWTGEQLKGWYGQAIPRLSGYETNVADSVRLALTGDAGQRVLIAWHLSWTPAVTIAGRTWIPPVLGRLLDDPYAAVRGVAERSLKKVSDLTPVGYDYTTLPESRPSVGLAVLEHWHREIVQMGTKPLFPTPALSGGTDASTLNQTLDQMVTNRDGKPVRLRE